MTELIKLQFILERLPMTVSERNEAVQALLAIQRNLLELEKMKNDVRPS